MTLSKFPHLCVKWSIALSFALADPGGAPGTRAPPGGPNSFIFMQFLAKNWKIIALLGVGAPPPGENPGSATGLATFFLLIILYGYPQICAIWCPIRACDKHRVSAKYIDERLVIELWFLRRMGMVRDGQTRRLGLFCQSLRKSRSLKKFTRRRTYPPNCLDLQTYNRIKLDSWGKSWTVLPFLNYNYIGFFCRENALMSLTPVPKNNERHKPQRILNFFYSFQQILSLIFSTNPQICL